MHWLDLPDPQTATAPAFQDALGAKAWLAAQPQTQPLHMLGALNEQICAIDAASLPPLLALELLGRMRTAAVPQQASIEPHFTRKPLPLPEEDQYSFAIAQQLWTKLGIAYLRLAPQLEGEARTQALNRAACSFRLAQYTHYLAAQTCPEQLDHLLLAVLVQAGDSDELYLPLSDPDFPHLGNAHLAGHLAWAFLLRRIDPYQLSASQLTVTNRAFSRWRELVTFQAEIERDPKARTLDLTAQFGIELPAGSLRYLNIRPVTRKILRRIESLAAGEAPESLKLGRELSAAACTRLLRQITAQLQSSTRQAVSEKGEIELIFGGEDIYALFSGEVLNTEHRSSSLAHQRMALFGFDRLSQMPSAVKKLTLPTEHWQWDKNQVLRLNTAVGERRLSPCLVATDDRSQPRLGVLFGLQTKPDGTLTAALRWFDGAVEACYPKPLPGKPKTPAFLLFNQQAFSLILPASSSTRPGNLIELQGEENEKLIISEVIERGIDFVRYACRPA